ncbi:MAG: S8 family peptidase [Bacteroidota bacterium]|nr:S8 family peptidase [Bacteroidota bacterium]
MKVIYLILSITVIALISFSLNNSTTSQNDLSNFYNDQNYKEGDLIVMFKYGVDAESFVNNYENIDMKIIEPLVKDMNIYLLQYDTKKSSPVDALVSVMRSDNVAIVQFNHYVTERVIPNDTRFAEQWDKNNTGQTGGTPDADIDAPEAWEVATGGSTALGDTIVVAIVDGGQQVDHPDLETWRNWAEIPGNSIDDDNNGYIDDINGWNASSNNGTIPAEFHGTHCAGIAGARGNNNQGVAGVNLKVKTMPVVYGISPTLEQSVVKAYGYVLKQRKIYNQTNGTQGAFVVSTNSSFGVDNGQPSNYPLWCGFYDSLGAAGILSAGAGPNNNVNIDIVGDIPTACPSPFMISVTNTTNTDAKNSGAGYGPINMDLGAPGTSILSTTPGGSYGLLTGTSMATPQVAGAIGLLYSGASSLFIQLAKNDPDSAALLFKQFILSSVDTIPALTGITVSNGRLNVNKMIQKVRVNVPVLHPFALTNPSAAARLVSLPFATNQYNFNWDTSATGATYRFVFGNPTTSTRKISIPAGINSLILTSGQLDNILAGLGLNQGDSLVGQWDAWSYRVLPVNDSLKSNNGPRAITLKRGVPPLTAFNLSTPPTGTTVQTTPTDYSNLISTWTKSGQGVKYKWIFATPNFSSSSNIKAIIQSENSGYDTVVNIRRSKLDSLAASLGAGNNDSISGQWRTYAYNLNDSIASSQTFDIRLRRLPISTVTIGTGTSDESYPLNRFYNYYRWQGLYLGSEIATNGSIRKIKFYQNNSVSGVTSENVRIFLKSTAEQLLPTGTWDTTGMTLVFSGTINSLASPGWVDIQLTNPFYFSSTENLIVSIGRDFQQFVTTYPRYAYTSTSTNYRTRRAQRDAQYPTTLTQNYNRANVQFELSLLTNVNNNLTSTPEIFSLSQNYPNPFNPTTKINYNLPVTNNVTLKIFDVLGKEVITLVNQKQNAGSYTVEFNGSNFASGVYFYRIEAGEYKDIKRMVLIK